MKSPSTRRQRAFVAGALIGGMLFGSIAWAAWLATGSGTASAKAQTATALTTADVSATTAATLYPGATGDALVRIDNPNPYPVRVTSISGSGPIVSDKGAACNAATGVTFSNVTGAALDVAANSAATFTLTGKVAMSNASDTTCQGAVFTIPVTLSGASNAS